MEIFHPPEGGLRGACAMVDGMQVFWLMMAVLPLALIGLALVVARRSGRAKE